MGSRCGVKVTRTALPAPRASDCGDLRRVLVPEDLVRPDVVGDLAEAVRLRRLAAGAGDARGRVDDDGLLGERALPGAAGRWPAPRRSGSSRGWQRAGPRRWPSGRPARAGRTRRSRAGRGRDARTRSGAGTRPRRRDGRRRRGPPPSPRARASAGTSSSDASAGVASSTASQPSDASSAWAFRTYASVPTAPPMPVLARTVTPSQRSLATKRTSTPVWAARMRQSSMPE